MSILVVFVFALAAVQNAVGKVFICCFFVSLGLLQ